MSRPLLHKLGFRPGHHVWVIGAPADYLHLLGEEPENIHLDADPEAGALLDAVHVFSTDRVELAAALPLWRGLIRPEGMIWISWPKRSSGVPTEVDGSVIRDLARPLGLIDVKVCSVDSTWSALKLCIRKEAR